MMYSWSNRLTLLALLTAFTVGVASCDDSGTGGSEDAIDTTISDTSTEDTEDTEDTSTDDASDTSGDQALDTTDPFPEPTSTPMPVGYDSVATDNAMESALAADFNGDGFADLIGLDDAGNVVVVAFDPRAGVQPPYTFGTPGNIAVAGSSPTLLTTGDFTGDGRLDLAVWDTNAGRVDVIVNNGASFDDPILAFDDPILAFDDPILAFDDPILAFDDPILAHEGSWAVGDFDGNGVDDIAFAVDVNGTSVGFMTAPGTGDSLSASLEQPSGLSDFEDPILASPRVAAADDIDLDGDADLFVGFALSDNPDNDGMGLFLGTDTQAFDDPILAFEDPILAFDDPILASSGGAMIPVSKGIASIDLAALDDTGAPDLAWMSVNSAENTASAGIWLSGNDALVAGQDLERFGFEGAAGRLEHGRLLLDQNVGTGAGGTDGLEFLNAFSHVLVLPPAGSSEPGLSIPVLDDGSIGTVLELLEAGGIGIAVDLNGDGFSEFIRPTASGFDVGVQETLSMQDTITLADGSTVQTCELAAPYCDRGALGICRFARDVCGTCTTGADFEAAFPTATFEDLYEPTETLCDGIDNDCDGMIDELPTVDVDVGALTGGAPPFFALGLPSEGGLAVLYGLEPGAFEVAWFADATAPTTPDQSYFPMIFGDVAIGRDYDVSDFSTAFAAFDTISGFTVSFMQIGSTASPYGDVTTQDGATGAVAALDTTAMGFATDSGGLQISNTDFAFGSDPALTTHAVLDATGITAASGLALLADESNATATDLQLVAGTPDTEVIVTTGPASLATVAGPVFAAEIGGRDSALCVLALEELATGVELALYRAELSFVEPVAGGPAGSLAANLTDRTTLSSSAFVDPYTLHVALASDGTNCHATWGTFQETAVPTTALHEAIVDDSGIARQRRVATVPTVPGPSTFTSYVTGGEAVWGWLEEDSTNSVYTLHLQRVCSPVTR